MDFAVLFVAVSHYYSLDEDTARAISVAKSSPSAIAVLYMSILNLISNLHAVL